MPQEMAIPHVLESLTLAGVAVTAYGMFWIVRVVVPAWLPHATRWGLQSMVFSDRLIGELESLSRRVR